MIIVALYSRPRHGGVRVEHLRRRRFGVHASPTALALTQVREHRRPVLPGAFAIDERGDQLIELMTRHRRTCPPALQPSSASNRSCSMRRPREMRDITVPIGTRSRRAMSA
jgi:hypothetical protein